MGSILRQALAAIEAQNGAVDVRELARVLGVSPDTLDGLIRYWLRKGRLVVVEAGPRGGSATDCAGCGGGCAVGCPFQTAGPRILALAPPPGGAPGPRTGAAEGDRAP